MKNLQHPLLICWILKVFKSSIAKQNLLPSASLRSGSMDDIYCFAELFGDALTAPFHRQLYCFLQGSIVGRYSTASQNCSATRRLLPFIANLIFSFMAQYTGTLVEIKAIRRLA
ncbi:hypothetical protein H5410_047759 [Solanum commersonii]|uniref:Uncharacterized protein n=1 Tax=Solanum commersonii TaxID=4109 RepID=A0A9J5XHX2_SOLCO|nr:hypothetical protein H5410_047759 [Solanum commersonii]